MPGSSAFGPGKGRLWRWQEVPIVPCPSSAVPASLPSSTLGASPNLSSALPGCPGTSPGSWPGSGEEGKKARCAAAGPDPEVRAVTP